MSTDPGDDLARLVRLYMTNQTEAERRYAQFLSDARISGFANGAAGIADRILALLPKTSEFTGNCCEHCAAIEDLLEDVR